MEAFLNASLVAGVAFAAAPIILHLIMRQKPRHIRFPAMQFLKRRHQQNTRRLRLQHLLLLLLRVLAICLMALGLARYRTMSNVSGGVLTDQEAPVAVVMAFDTSPRMEYVFENLSRIEHSQEISKWLIGQLPQESEVAVLDSSLRSALFQLDILAAEERIGRLKTTTRPESLSLMLEKSVELLDSSELTRKELYVFTDLTESAWVSANMSKVRELMERHPEIAVYIIDVGVKEPRNFALGDLQLSSEVTSLNTRLHLRSEIMRQGPEDTREIALELARLGEQPQRFAIQSKTVGSGDSQALEFPLGGLEVGLHQGEVRLVGDDALDFDNVRYFTLEIRPAWNVLLVARTKFEAGFLDQALAPEQLKAKQRARYHTNFVTYKELADLRLGDEYTAVCLLDPPPLPDALWRSLQEYVLNGGGLAVFLGPNAAIDEQEFNGPVVQELLPGKLFQQGRSPDTSLFLTHDDYSHPIVSRFRLPGAEVPWQQFPVFYYWQLESTYKDVQTVIRYSNDEPALLDRSIGKGKVLTMTTPISQAPSQEGRWNLLVMDWPFTMLSDQMMLYLAGSLEGSYNFRVGSNARLTLPSELPRTNFAISVPSGEIFTQNSVPGEKHLILTRTNDPGNYVVRGTSAEGPVELGFSVNLPRSASLLQRIEPAELEEIFGEHPYQVARTKEEITRAQGTGRVGQELFPLLMVLLVIILSAETFVSNRFYKPAQASG